MSMIWQKTISTETNEEEQSDEEVEAERRRQRKILKKQERWFKHETNDIFWFNIDSHIKMQSFDAC